MAVEVNELSGVLSKESAVLADFYSETCVPCRQMSPVLEELEHELSGSVKAVKVNVASNSELAESYGVRAVPTFIMFKNGGGLLGAGNALVCCLRQRRGRCGGFRGTH